MPEKTLKPIDFEALASPFEPCDLEWRVAMSGFKNGKPWARCLVYVTNRAVQSRLDSVVHPTRWKNEFNHIGGGVLCGLSIKVGEEWITKWDGATPTDIEPVKGGISGAMKRAAVHWGVGRYLYDMGDSWANFDEDGIYTAVFKNRDGTKSYWKWNPPLMPDWAMPEGSSMTDPSEYAAAMPQTVPTVPEPRAKSEGTRPEAPQGSGGSSGSSGGGGGGGGGGKYNKPYSGQPIRNPDDPMSDGQKRMLFRLLKLAKDRMAPETHGPLYDAVDRGELTKQAASDAIGEIQETYGV